MLSLKCFRAFIEGETLEFIGRGSVHHVLNVPSFGAKVNNRCRAPTGKRKVILLTPRSPVAVQGEHGVLGMIAVLAHKTPHRKTKITRHPAFSACL